MHPAARTTVLRPTVLFKPQASIHQVAAAAPLSSSLRLHINMFALLAVAESEGNAHCEPVWLLGQEITETNICSLAACNPEGR